MAQNNYYHFPHGGGPYSNPGYLGQPNMTPGFSGHGPVAGSYPTARAPAGYDQNYAIHNAVANYGYTPRAQQPGPVGYPADTNQYPTGNPAAMYNYPANSSSYTNTYNSVVTNYAASALYNQQASVSHHDNSGPSYPPGKPTNWNFKKNLRGNKIKTAPKAPQLMYCEVCKISCAGPQTYKEHLEGQRHKKKEAQMKSSSSAPNKRGPAVGVSLRCELCDVTCTGNDAYAAHIRGSKHQKVLKLHTKLGKPIPQTDHLLNQKPRGPANSHQPQSTTKINVLGTPKISFVEGGRLQTTGGRDNQANTAPNRDGPVAENAEESLNEDIDDSGLDSNLVIDIDKTESQPVGQGYVEEIKSDESKSISFHCKLCDCRFNDPNAKELHLKGRRHRLQYKKKVDPNLVVDIKPSVKQRKNQEIKDRRYFPLPRGARDQYWNDWRGPPIRFMGENRYDNRAFPPHPPHMMPPSGFSGQGPMMANPFRRTHPGNTLDDNHIFQKHSEICPSDTDLDKLRRTVSTIEKSIKILSDKIFEDPQGINEDPPLQVANSEDDVANKDVTQGLFSTTTQLNGNQSTTDTEKSDEVSNNRVFKGLMRVGPLAKDLVLNSDREVDLIIICSERPTVQLVEKVSKLLQGQLEINTPDEFTVIPKVEDAAMIVSPGKEDGISVKITFTSPSVRDSSSPEGIPAEMVKDSKQLLDKQKCLNALAALRRAKWYQARVSNLYPCPIIIRLLRDLCWRLPTWSKLNCWSVELLAERVISSAREQLTPAEAFRHILEAIASGLLLPGGAGLRDPCEKDPVDALANMSRQEREEVTASAQHALRLIAFRQIHKILAIDPLQSRRKRKYEVESEEPKDQELIDKKVKKEDEDQPSQEPIPDSSEAQPEVQN